MNGRAATTNGEAPRLSKGLVQSHKVTDEVLVQTVQIPQVFLGIVNSMLTACSQRRFSVVLASIDSVIECPRWAALNVSQ
jgi:hypothetical protein